MNKYRSSVHKVRTLHDLELEKARLEIDILKSEDSIRSSYRQLTNRLSFRNLAGTLADEISSGSSVLSQAISYGRAFLEKRKKKKKEKERAKLEKTGTVREENLENKGNSNSD